MESLTRPFRLAVVLAGLLFAATATAAQVTFDWAVVGDAANAGDVQPQGTFGSVSSAYRISRHEVTNAQYVEFLNAKDPGGNNALFLYDQFLQSEFVTAGINRTPGNPSGSKYSVKPGLGNKPVTGVSWYDAIRFANWVNNGQGAAADTETGAYTLNGVTELSGDGTGITRNLGASVFLPSVNEWHKAAFYKGGGTNAGYWDYATQTDAVPISDQPPGAFAPANSANFWGDDGLDNGYYDGYAMTGTARFDGSQSNLADVGAYAGSLSAYGTFDQGGNVYEWNEDIFQGTLRVVRGGSYASTASFLAASFYDGTGVQGNVVDVGFRLASVPEPAGITGPLAAAVLLTRRRHACGTTLSTPRRRLPAGGTHPHRQSISVFSRASEKKF
jgi:formylglycine-generating enzyme required for sulfatase activity